MTKTCNHNKKIHCDPVHRHVLWAPMAILSSIFDRCDELAVRALYTTTTTTT